MGYVIGTLLIAALIYFLYSRSAKGKGRIGEREVAKIIGHNKEDEQYVFNDVLLKNDGKSTQIDHIVIKRTGIFVLETKNYAGDIYGNETQREWTQVLSYGQIKNKFYNPILQNKSHIYTLSKVLGNPGNFVSIIVFPKAIIQTKTATPVVDLSGIKKVMNKHTLAVFTVRQIKTMTNTLQQLVASQTITERQHVKNIRTMKKNMNKNICPRCGSELVQRKGKYGAFYGCSAYPQCKFVKKDKF